MLLKRLCRCLSSGHCFLHKGFIQLQELPSVPLFIQCVPLDVTGVAEEGPTEGVRAGTRRELTPNSLQRAEDYVSITGADRVSAVWGWRAIPITDPV